MAVQNYHRSESALGHWFRRLRSKIGTIAAVTAAAHKLARILYAMVKTRTPYDPELTSNSDLHNLRQTRNLQRQAEKLGYQLIPAEPKAKRRRGGGGGGGAGSVATAWRPAVAGSRMEAGKPAFLGVCSPNSHPKRTPHRPSPTPPPPPPTGGPRAGRPPPTAGNKQ